MSNILSLRKLRFPMINIHSMKFRIMAVGMALVLLGIVIRLLLGMPVMQEQVLGLVTAQQMSMATYIARDVDQNIHTRLDNITQLAKELPAALISQPAALQTWVRERQRINPLFNSGLIVVRPDGKGLLGEYPRVPGRNRLDFSTSDWFIGALRTNAAIMGKPARGRATGDPLIIMAAPIRDEAGQLVAVLAGVALLNAKGFLDNFLEARLGATGSFLLISPADQLFVGSSDPAMVLQPTPAPGINPLHDKAMGGYRGSGITTNAHGVEELASMVTVPSTGWFVVARMPTAEALGPVNVMRGYVLKSSLLLVVLMLILMSLLLPRLLRPLEQAAVAIKAMADGHQQLAPLPVQGRDEVGNLVSGFNSLVERLLAQETALKASEARLAFMAHHDPLTGLPNRALLEERLQQAAARAQRHDGKLALLFCDLDGFKQINDQYGHEAGDAVLIQVAERLKDGRRSTDTVARLGGDEFVILLSDLENAEAGARAVAEQCLSVLKRPIEVDGVSLCLGISIGIALHQGSSVSTSHLLSRADMAMYQVKRAGKGNLAFFSEDAQEA